MLKTKKRKITPKSWRILVRPHKGEDGVVVPEELKQLGFEVKQGMDADEVRRSVLSLEMGTILQIGPLAWMRQDMQGNRPPEQWEPWFKVGDQIIFGKYAGKLIKDWETGEYVMLMNDEDCQCLIEDTEDGTEQE